ncbi:MAG: hypothetical protein K2J74_04555, partial [Muribaculaceae bacterium]|nr:hypothetical protein [Muribaculaceae bacterium]
MNKIHDDISDDEIRIISSENVSYSHNKEIENDYDIDSSFTFRRESYILSPKPMAPKRPDRKPKRYWLYIVIVLCMILIGAVIYALVKSDDDATNTLVTNIEKAIVVADSTDMAEISDTAEIKLRGDVELSDTTINGISLSILTPRNATPHLHIGADALRDSSAIMVVQAADVRSDNGEIVGTYVHEGKLISKGQSKSGFCAIIGGIPIIGVADSTPYLEQAIESGGYFFRQY